MSAAESLRYPSDDPAAVSGTATRCLRLAAVVARAADDLRGDATLLDAAWAGPAARGCREEMSAVTGLVRSLVDPLCGAAAVLHEHADVVAEGRAAVDRLRREYDALQAQHRQDVSRLSGGAPMDPYWRLIREDARASHQMELAALHRRHGEVLDRVSEHARSTARRLVAAAEAVRPRAPAAGRSVGAREGDLAALLPLLALARAAAGVGASPPPQGTPPELVRQWWAVLTADEQQRFVNGWPTAVGSLSGLAAQVRSAANERRLERDVAMLRARPDLSDDEQRWLATCLTVQRELARLRATADPFSLEATTAQLLVFDPTAYGYQGRAAIVVGDADTADHVAFLVPGLGSEVRTTMPDLAADALRVTTAARRASPGTTTATVAWLGYDAPGLGDAVFDGAAEAGADLLVADVLAVQAARDVVPHLTVVGHSYGSTTVGTALRDRETGTDDVVLVGSPGPNVEAAGDLHLPAGHVFVGASSRDPVSYVDRFGADPAHAGFGATRFQAEDPTRSSWRLDFDDHAKYFNAGTESLANIVDIVTGDYAAVDRAPYRDEVFLLPDGINSDPEADREPTTVR